MGVSRKLEKNYSGLWYIYQILPHNAFRLINVDTGKILKYAVNAQRLKHAYLPKNSRIRSHIPNRMNPDNRAILLDDASDIESDSDSDNESNDDDDDDEDDDNC